MSNFEKSDACTHEEGDVLGIVEHELREIVCEFAVDEREVLVGQFIERLVNRLGGSYVYIPRQTAKRRRQIRKELAAKFDGRNATALAREYGLSVRHVRRIIAANQGLSVDEFISSSSC